MFSRSLSTPSASANLKMVVMMILRVSWRSRVSSSCARFGFDQVGDIGGVEGGADLGVQVDAVDDDQHGGIAQGGLQAQLLGGKDHQQGFARALEMPDQPLARVAGQHALDDLVGAVVLLVAADDLQAAVLFVGGEQGEVGQDVEDDVRAQQGLAVDLRNDPPARPAFDAFRPAARDPIDRAACGCAP